MIFDIDTTSSLPIYAQLVAQVKHAVAAGILRPGDALPSLRETASSLRVNPLTVSKAYRELETAGIVTMDHGRGTFVSLKTVALGDGYRSEALDQAVDHMLVEAYHLGASPDEIRQAVEDRLHKLAEEPNHMRPIEVEEKP